MSNSTSWSKSPGRLLDLTTIRQEKARRSRDNFHRFVLFTKPDFTSGWVHEVICDALQTFLADVIAKRSPRLMIFLPPRHTKSELASRRFPAWALGRHPDLSFIGTSYGADLSSMINRDVQRIIDSDEYREVFPGTTLYGKTTQRTTDGAYLRNSELFEIVGHQGVYRSAGVGGGITGMGADVLAIDDPIKDARQADSVAYRESIWHWYTSTAYTRLSPGGGVILIQTRWNEDDLAGRALEQAKRPGADQWRVISLPAIAEEVELHRNPGEALHPARYPLSRLREIEASVPPRVWTALYQQRPSPTDGAIFKSNTFAFWQRADQSLEPVRLKQADGTHYEAPLRTLPDRMTRLAQSWDMAFKDTDSSAYVAGQVWGEAGPDFYLLDQYRAKADFVGTLDAVRQLTANWPAAKEKWVEDKANGPAVLSVLKREIAGFVAIEPDGSKEARAWAVSPLFRGGNVILPHPSVCPWVAELLKELLAFPNGAYADQVDALTQALIKFSGAKVNYSTLDFQGIAAFGTTSSAWGGMSV